MDSVLYILHLNMKVLREKNMVRNLVFMNAAVCIAGTGYAAETWAPERAVLVP
jgi:hypothetical protein